MDVTELVPFIALLGVMVAMLGVTVAMWSQLNSRMNALTTLLTENLIALNREMGELKGGRHTPAGG